MFPLRLRFPRSLGQLATSSLGRRRAHTSFRCPPLGNNLHIRNRYPVRYLSAFCKKNNEGTEASKTVSSSVDDTSILSKANPTERAIFSAIIGNTCVFVAKSLAAFYSGSGVMFAEGKTKFTHWLKLNKRTNK